MNILGIDVGPERSAYCWLHCRDTGIEIGSHEWIDNAALIAFVSTEDTNGWRVVLESPQAQDRPLGRLLRDTIIMAGRIIEICSYRQIVLIEADERDVRARLCGSRSSNNAALLQALKDDFGDKSEESCLHCKGAGTVLCGLAGKQANRTKKCPTCKGRCFTVKDGPLPKNEHCRSALAAAYWYWLKHQDSKTFKLRELVKCQTA